MGSRSPLRSRLPLGDCELDCHCHYGGWLRSPQGQLPWAWRLSRRKSDAEHYASERATEQREVDVIPDKEREEVELLLLTYGLEKKQSTLVANALSKRPEAWIDFMMRLSWDSKNLTPNAP